MFREKMTGDLMGEAQKKILNEIYGVDANDQNEEENAEPTPEEWVWVEGYKATDKNMCCKDYQYELGKQHDMPEDAEISSCSSGFHLCLKLSDVFGYYEIRNDNRFFKVKALVRKSEVDRYGRHTHYMFGYRNNDKLAAKSIIFTEECTLDEIFKATKAADWSEEDKKLAISIGIKGVQNIRRTNELVSLGYSEGVAKYICENGKYEDATVFASMPDLSIDTKMLLIFRHDL
jgi:hypothetical protein